MSTAPSVADHPPIPTPSSPHTAAARTASHAGAAHTAGSNRHLLAAVAAGDEGAMAAVWATYAGPVRSLARSLSRATASDADDVVQETLTRVWKGAARFDPSRGSEATFVFTIARRVVIDRWRKTTTRPVEAAFDDRYAPTDARAEQEYDRIVVQFLVRESIESLSAPHRQVVELAYVDGLSQSEIADRLGIPLGTVKTRTFAALRALRPLLADRDAVH